VRLLEIWNVEWNLWQDFHQGIFRWQQVHFEINYRLVQTAVKYFPENQLYNHTNGVEEAYFILLFKYILILIVKEWKSFTSID
jgi:hypothetical protein